MFHCLGTLGHRNQDRDLKVLFVMFSHTLRFDRRLLGNVCVTSAMPLVWYTAGSAVDGSKGGIVWLVLCMLAHKTSQPSVDKTKELIRNRLASSG